MRQASWKGAHQDLGYLGAGELFGRHLAPLSSISRTLVPLRKMRSSGVLGAGFAGRHLLAAGVVEGVFETQRGDGQLRGGVLLEDVLGVVGAVVVAHPGVITAHDEVGAAIILAADGVEDRLTGSGVAHGGGVGAEHHPALRVVALEQYQVAAHAHLGGNVIGLGGTHQRVDEQAVDHFERALGQILVGAVDGIPGLEGDHGVPFALGELGAGSVGGEGVVDKRLIGQLVDQHHRAAEVDRSRLTHRRNAGVGPIGGSVDALGLVILIGAELVVHRHDREHGAVRMGQGDVLVERAAFGFLIGHLKTDGDAPGVPFREPHIVDDGVVVLLSDEALEGAVDAGGDALEIVEVAVAERQGRQRSGCLQSSVALAAGQLAFDQVTAVRVDEGLVHTLLLSSENGAVGARHFGQGYPVVWAAMRGLEDRVRRRRRRPRSAG